MHARGLLRDQAGARGGKNSRVPARSKRVCVRVSGDSAPAVCSGLK